MKITGNKNKLEIFKKLVSSLSKLQVHVGYFDGEKNNKNELTLATVAKINEYGSVKAKIPARPFMRMTFRRHDNFKLKFKAALKQTLNNTNTLTESYSRFGIYAMQSIQKEIMIGEFRQNADYTIKKKKSSRPLMDTGQLRRAVSWRIVR